jgi:hypothetical protein
VPAIPSGFLFDHCNSKISLGIVDLSAELDAFRIADFEGTETRAISLAANT